MLLILFTNFENMKRRQEPEIHFFSQGNKLGLRNRGKLKQFLQSLALKEGKKIAVLNYIFCKDEELLEINKTYLKHNFYTDIITFGLSEKNDPITGDIYISIDRVRENAKKMGNSINSETHRVIFHGLLHLCGYKDKESAQQEEMRKAEDLYLKRYFG